MSIIKSEKGQSNILTKFCLFLILLMTVVMAGAVNYNMPYYSTTTYSLSADSTYHIYDNGGSSGNYSNNCNGTMYLNAPSGYRLRIVGTYDTENNYDCLHLYNGSSTSAQHSQHSGSGTINMLSSTNSLVIRFTSDGSVQATGFHLTITLETNTPPVIDSSQTGGVCIDFTDLSDPSVTCYTGYTHDVDAYVGRIQGRHTVITSASFDPRTDNQLRTIPPGEQSSVKLGNEQVNYGQESVVYMYRVDTSVHDLLVLKYAAVLQNPNHNYSSQPRFKFDILDANMQPLNAQCYSADYVAGNTTSGWRTASDGVLWKDWTTVGVDLRNLHGQVVYVRLSTYDCNRSAHYGYAYYHLSCSNMVMQSTSCGSTITNTFTAPEGFVYRWYRESDPSSTISTNRSITVTQPDSYCCNMTMIGASSQQCGIVMRAVAGYRYPYARFTEVLVDSVNCQQGWQFHDNSIITTDEAHTQLTSEGCEGSEWDFGDGDSSNDRNPLHYYALPGTYHVRLVSTLSNGQCQDTTYHDVVVNSPCWIADTIHVSRCPGEGYLFYDTTVYQPGTYTHDQEFNHHVLIFSHFPAMTTVIHDTIVENQLPWQHGGNTYVSSVSGDSIMLTTADGCDSLELYSLHVWMNTQITVDSTLCENELPLTWNNVTFVSTETQSAVFHTVHGADSLVTMHVHVQYNSHDTVHRTIVENNLPDIYAGHIFEGNVTDSTLIVPNVAGCDSLINYNLTVYYNDTTIVDSTLCENYLPLIWNGVSFTASGVDTVKFYKTNGADSVVVMLVHVLYNSYDTVHRTIVENNLPDIYAGHIFEGNVTDSTLIVPNATGCDSLIYYNLTVFYNDTLTYDSTICEKSLPLLWNGKTFVTEGVDTATLHDIHNADSVVIMTLHVLYNSYDTIHHVVLENNLPDVHAGHSFSSEVSDSTLIIPNVAGCDSLISYSLMVHWNDTVALDSALCENYLPIVWNGVTFTETSVDTVKYYNIFGADSVVVMHFTKLENSSDTVHQTILVNSLPAQYAGYSFSHDVRDTLLLIPNTAGCDSLITYSLTINYNDTIRVDSTICENNLPLQWNGATFTSDGIDTIKYFNRYGADSVIIMTLHVNPAFQEDRMAVICDNMTYLFDWEEVSTPGDWTHSLLSIHNCDSIIMLHLTVNSTYNTQLDIHICDGQHYEMGGEVYEHNGDYETKLTSMENCDSLVSLHLNVHPNYSTRVDSVDCHTGYITYNGEVFQNSGMYIQHFPTVAHCDSVLYLNFHIENPPSAEAHAEPSRADFEHRVIRLSSRSHHATNNQWFIDRDLVSEDAVFYYDYPDDIDSVEVMLISYSENGCSDTAWVVIPFVKAIVWAPNVFTPNEASNNKFCIYEDEMVEGHVWLYTRQGVFVTDFDAMTECWDGTYKGSVAPQNAYVWVLRYHTRVDPKNELVKKGTVVLLK